MSSMLSSPLLLAIAASVITAALLAQTASHTPTTLISRVVGRRERFTCLSTMRRDVRSIGNGNACAPSDSPCGCATGSASGGRRPRFQRARGHSQVG